MDRNFHVSDRSLYLRCFSDMFILTYLGGLAKSCQLSMMSKFV